MALKCNLAEYRPLEILQRQPHMQGHDIGCVHTMVGYLISTDGYFRQGGWTGTESHFGVGGEWGPDLGGHMDGRAFQWQDCMYTADANYRGSPRVMSIETADNAPQSARDIKPWTLAQCDTIVALLDWWCRKETHQNCPSAWLCHQQGIPRELIVDTKPGRRGLAYHAQGVPGNGLVPGGVAWSTSRGKECPGLARISQFKNVIVPRVKALGKVGGEDDMAVLTNIDAAAQRQLNMLVVAAIRDEFNKPGSPTRRSIDEIFEDNFQQPGSKTRIGLEQVVNKVVAAQLKPIVDKLNGLFPEPQ